MNELRMRMIEDLRLGIIPTRRSDPTPRRWPTSLDISTNHRINWARPRSGSASCIFSTKESLPGGHSRFEWRG